jgi:hypothetical protein
MRHPQTPANSRALLVVMVTTLATASITIIWTEELDPRRGPAYAGTTTGILMDRTANYTPVTVVLDPSISRPVLETGGQVAALLRCTPSTGPDTTLQSCPLQVRTGVNAAGLAASAAQWCDWQRTGACTQRATLLVPALQSTSLGPGQTARLRVRAAPTVDQAETAFPAVQHLCQRCAREGTQFDAARSHIAVLLTACASIAAYTVSMAAVQHTVPLTPVELVAVNIAADGLGLAAILVPVDRALAVTGAGLAVGGTTLGLVIVAAVFSTGRGVNEARYQRKAAGMLAFANIVALTAAAVTLYCPHPMDDPLVAVLGFTAVYTATVVAAQTRRLDSLSLFGLAAGLVGAVSLAVVPQLRVVTVFTARVNTGPATLALLALVLGVGSRISPATNARPPSGKSE